MAGAGPFTLQYTTQPAGSRVTLVETGDALTLTVPARGTWGEFRDWLLFLPLLALPYAPMIYFTWWFSRNFNAPLPIPWVAMLGPLVFAVLFNLAIAWLIGGVSTTVTVTRDRVTLSVEGRIRTRSRTFPRHSFAQVLARWWTNRIELRDDSRRLVCSIGIPVRSDRQWVAETLRAKLGLAS